MGWKEREEKRKPERDGRREENTICSYITCNYYVASSSTISLTVQTLFALYCFWREKKKDSVPVQVKSSDFCIVSLEIREVVEVIIGFLVSLLPARERQNQTTAHNTLINFIMTSSKDSYAFYFFF